MLSSGFLVWNFLFGSMANNHNHRHGEKILFIKELFSEKPREGPCGSSRLFPLCRGGGGAIGVWAKKKFHPSEWE